MDFGFDHVHFLVSDVQTLTDYFEKVFGMEVIDYKEDHKGAAYTIFKFGNGTLRIRGMRKDDKPDSRCPDLVEGLDHIGLSVKNVRSALTWLVSRGAEVFQEPEDTGIGGRTIAFIKGPGNIRIELCQKTEYT
tara:strand:- start:862 stop:1260 length:399 start_codon:yes stop_codon:yes gene_type:complete